MSKIAVLSLALVAVVLALLLLDAGAPVTAAKPPISPPIGPPVSPPIGPPVSPPVGPHIGPPIGPPVSPPVGPPISPPPRGGGHT
jgi:hypothetical protein